ncbi:hypothetical protein T06_14884 [Trichinella sp. T6]|nr:hypothetical protein T06_14884 [Trichinella sp. T6]
MNDRLLIVKQAIVRVENLLIKTCQVGNAIYIFLYPPASSLTVFELLNELTIIFYCVKENVQKPQI